MSHSSIRLAVIGCPGNPALWRDIAMRLQDACFTVVVDNDARLGKSMAEAIGASVVVGSLEAALNRHSEEFDAVIVSTSLSNGPELAQLAGRAQKHMMVDAPVAGSLAEAEAMIDAAEQQGVCFAVRETLRLTPSVRVIKDRLAMGKLGHPGLLRVHRWRSIHHDKRPHLAHTLFADVDLALWLFNARPTEVYALTRGGGGGGTGTTPDYIQVHFGFPSGAMALLDFSAAHPEGKGYDSWSLIGSTGAAYADDHHNTHLLFKGGNPAALISDQGYGHLALELQGFVDAIKGKTGPPVGSKDCLAVHQVIEAIERSLKARQVIHEKSGVYV